MRLVERVSPWVSLATLAVILLFASLHLSGSVAFSTYIKATNLCTVVWFVVAPWWLLPKKDSGGLP